jgi:putative endonuclease
MAAYFAYIVECADGTFYSGITTDLDRRINEHNESPKGAKYTRARRPVRPGYQEEFATRSEAQKREAEFKGMSRQQKQSLAALQ